MWVKDSIVGRRRMSSTWLVCIGLLWGSMRLAPDITRSQKRGGLFAISLEAIGRGLKVPVVAMSPEEAAAHFGFYAMFAGRDLIVSSKLTQERLGWSLTGPGLLSDLGRMQYFAN